MKNIKFRTIFSYICTDVPSYICAYFDRICYLFRQPDKRFVAPCSTTACWVRWSSGVEVGF